MGWRVISLSFVVTDALVSCPRNLSSPHPQQTLVYL